MTCCYIIGEDSTRYRINYLTFSFIKQEIQLAGTNQPNQFHITNWACKSQGQVSNVPHLFFSFPQLSSTFLGYVWSQSSWWLQLSIELNSVNYKVGRSQCECSSKQTCSNTIVIAEKIEAVWGWNSALCYNVVLLHFLSSGKCKSFNPSSTSYLIYPIKFRVDRVLKKYLNLNLDEAIN